MSVIDQREAIAAALVDFQSYPLPESAGRAKTEIEGTAQAGVVSSATHAVSTP